MTTSPRRRFLLANPKSAIRNPKSAFRPRRPLFESLENRALLTTSPVQVLLMIGQSNMAGYPSSADLTAPLDAPQSDVWIWQDDLAQNEGWTALRGGFGNDTSNFGSGGDGTRFGPEVSLGRALADASPDSQYAIVKHVQAGTAATMHDGWNPDRGGGAGPGRLWIDFVAKTHEALNALSASELEYEVAGLFVFQGNRDAVNETGVEAANYEQNFTDFISGVRQEFATPEMPVVFTELPEYKVVGSGASGYGNTLLVRNGQKAVDAAVPLTTMIEANDFSRIVDGTHFDAEGQIGFGQRFAAAHLSLPYEGSARVGSDGFESGTFTSGFEQWADGAWSASGDAIVTTAGAPFDNAHHVRLSNSTGDLTRAVDATGLINEKLRFWSKLDSFESGDKAFVKISADGTNWTTVREFVDGEDDNVYRYHEIDLPDMGNTIYLRFDAAMNESSDYWYLDDVIIEGTTPPGIAEFAISSASATEGSTALKFLDPFVPSSSGGASTPRGVTFGPDGNLYIGHLNQNAQATVLRFDGQTGAFIDVFAEGSSVASQTSKLVFHNGYLFAAMGSGILRFDAITGAPAPAPGNPGALFATTVGQGLLDGVHGFAIGPDGHLYLTSNLSNQVLKYDGSTGQFASVFIPAGRGGLTQGNDLLFGADGHLYVASNGSNAVLRYRGPLQSNPGAFIDTFVAPGSGGLSWISSGGMKFGPSGDFYLSSRNNHSVLRFNGVTGAFKEAVVPASLGGLNTTGGFVFDPAGNLYVASQNTNQVLRYGAQSLSAFTVSLSSPATSPVTVTYATSSGSAFASSDFQAAAGTITFAPGQTSRTILVQTLDDTGYEGNETFTVNLSNPIGGVIVDGQGVGTIVDNDPQPTKFYVVDDASANKTFEYGATGSAIENYNLNSANSAPRGAASTAAGDKVWVVDSNKKVYVYNAAGGLLGSWTAGTLPSNANVQGVTTNGTDVWIVDAQGDKVYRYTGAASRTSGSQNAASSFNLNSSNKDATDLVTDGTSIWVLNNTSSSDKVFKYTVGGSLLGSWTIQSGGGSPTGLTIDPASVLNIWIVDSSSDRIYQFNAAATRTSGSQSPSTSFALASGNSYPQGLADPPVSQSAIRNPKSAISPHDTALLALTNELTNLLLATKKRR